VAKRLHPLPRRIRPHGGHRCWAGRGGGPHLHRLTLQASVLRVNPVPMPPVRTARTGIPASSTGRRRSGRAEVFASDHRGRGPVQQCLEGTSSGRRQFGDASFLQTDASVNRQHGGLSCPLGEVVGRVSWNVAGEDYEGLGLPCHFRRPPGLTRPAGLRLGRSRTYLVRYSSPRSPTPPGAPTRAEVRCRLLVLGPGSLAASGSRRRSSRVHTSGGVPMTTPVWVGAGHPFRRLASGRRGWSLLAIPASAIGEHEITRNSFRSQWCRGMHHYLNAGDVQDHGTWTFLKESAQVLAAVTDAARERGYEIKSATRPGFCDPSGSSFAWHQLHEPAEPYRATTRRPGRACDGGTVSPRYRAPRRMTTCPEEASGSRRRRPGMGNLNHAIFSHCRRRGTP